MINEQLIVGKRKWDASSYTLYNFWAPLFYFWKGLLECIIYIPENSEFYGGLHSNSEIEN